MTQFNITITRHVTGCGPNIEGSVDVIATPSMVIDNQQRYILESNGWWATSEITSTLAPSGVSTGLNASSTDTTATVITNVVATFGKLLITGASLASEFGPPLQLCKDDVLKAVGELYPPKNSKQLKLKEIVDNDTAALASATAKVVLLTAQAQADKSYQKDVAKALQDQAAAQKILSDDQEKLTRYLKLTTDTQVVSWPLMASEFRKDSPYDLSEGAFGKWTGLKTDTPELLALFKKFYDNEKKQFAVHLALYRLEDSTGKWIPPSVPATSNVKLGVPIRLAKTGRLLVCVKRGCPPEIPIDGVKTPDVSASDQTVLQIGQLYTVPVTGGTFRAQSTAIVMDSNGLPTSVKVAETVAAAAVATGAAKDVATQLASLPADVRAAQLAHTKAKTDQLNAQSALAAAQATSALSDQSSGLAAQTALINAQTALANAQANAGITSQTTALAAQTALLNAQTALANAQANALIVDQTSALAAQTTLLNAQAAQINAATALAKAKAMVP